ncbi:MAG: peptidase M16 [Candidatus Micrarchaeota archaeon]|nr:MAG: peptidase M16 [Candidatus Micrarchaeota archaeon]
MYNIERFSLSNGIRCYFVYNESDNISVRVRLNGGWLFERLEDREISHIIEHMLFKGTSKRNYYSILKDLDSTGAHWNASTSYDYITLSLDFHRDMLNSILDITADILFNSVIDQRYLLTERNVVINELLERNYKLDRFAAYRSLNTIYFSRDLAPPIERLIYNVEHISRERLYNRYKALLSKDNIEIIVVGKLSKDDAQSYLERYMGVNELTAHSKQEPIIPKERSKSIIIKRAYTNQAVISYNFRLQDISSLKSYIGIEILRRIITHKLFKDIRAERGLIYTPKVSFTFSRYISFIHTYIATNLGKLRVAREAIESVIRSFEYFDINRSEFDVYKSNYKFSYKMFKEDSAYIADLVSDIVNITNEDLIDLDSEIDEISYDDISELSSRYIKPEYAGVLTIVKD